MFLDVCLQVFVCDGVFSAARAVPLVLPTTSSAGPYRSTALKRSLDPSLHLVQQQRTATLLSGETLAVQIASDTKVSGCWLLLLTSSLLLFLLWLLYASVLLTRSRGGAGDEGRGAAYRGVMLAPVFFVFCSWALDPCSGVCTAVALLCCHRMFPRASIYAYAYVYVCVLCRLRTTPAWSACLQCTPPSCPASMPSTGSPSGPPCRTRRRRTSGCQHGDAWCRVSSPTPHPYPYPHILLRTHTDTQSHSLVEHTHAVLSPRCGVLRVQWAMAASCTPTASIA
jgi:hypothetical protein